MQITVQADRTLVRTSGDSTRYALLTFTAPQATRAATREPINIAFVIDRSGSMGGEKIRLAREAVVEALGMLRPPDRFAVVMYDSEIDVVVQSTLASAEAIRNAIAQVQRIDARGSTDLCGGWLKGCEEIAAHLRPEQVSKCVLLTDGLANQGITDRDELTRHAAELRTRGITTTTIGLGADFDERLLEAMAHAAGGHFYFVERAVQIADCLTSELGEMLEIVARDVVVSVRPDAGVRATALNRLRLIEPQAGGISVSIGDLTSRQDLALVFKLVFPQAQKGWTTRALFSLVDREGALRVADTDLVWTFDDPPANDAQHRNVVVDREVAKLYAAKAMGEALELNRAGRFEQASAVLEQTASRVQEYAGNDPELLAVVESLRRRASEYQAPMMPLRAKEEYFASSNMVAMRCEDGKARRRPGT
jgi:Ca-activated chloride channel family protein